jgi:outer membrane protein assembly factor BamB
VDAAPVIGPDGTLYVGSFDGHLYALRTDSPGLARSPWPMFRQNPQHTGAAPR